MMELNRYGEQTHPTFRNQRFHSVNGQWFFDTREGNQFGPFMDKSEAKKALSVFIAKQLLELHASRPDVSRAHYGAQDGIEHMLEELTKYYAYRKEKGQTAVLSWASRRINFISNNPNAVSDSEERIEAIQYAMENE